MTSGSAHPSTTSVDSTTALARSYRPPQKDYAAAFAALQDAYGTTPGLPSPKSAATTGMHARGGALSKQAPPRDVDAATDPLGAKEMGKRLMRGVGAMLRRLFRLKGGDYESSTIHYASQILKVPLPAVSNSVFRYASISKVISEKMNVMTQDLIVPAAKKLGAVDGNDSILAVQNRVITLHTCIRCSAPDRYKNILETFEYTPRPG
ncbi:hypothetical protein DFH09DRAFT_1365937 [Mycena vulgaris]|nr:hypothetical protein DFH09DRAFT_1365937 [Mycena vulgaris]